MPVIGITVAGPVLAHRRDGDTVLEGDAGKGEGLEQGGHENLGAVGGAMPQI